MATKTSMFAPAGRDVPYDTPRQAAAKIIKKKRASTKKGQKIKTGKTKGEVAFEFPSKGEEAKVGGHRQKRRDY